MADRDILKDCGVDLLWVVVSRKDVETSDVNPTLKVLNRLLQDKETVVRFRGRLDLSFEGYDHDMRELYEIEEVRGFLAHLDRRFPFWLYFLNLQSGTLLVVLSCLCQYSKEPGGMLLLDPTDRERFLVEHFTAVNWLFEKYGMDERDNEGLTMQVSNYLEKKRIPPVIQ